MPLTSTQIIVLATPVFFGLIAFEWWWGVRRARNTYRLADSISSVGLGVIGQVLGALSKVLTIGIYTAVFAAVHAAPAGVASVANPAAPSFWLSIWGFLFALLIYDFFAYWMHRAGHEVAVVWAAHVVHHQSQEYNLSTALRQTSSGVLLGWVFFLPMALLGVPPEVFALVALVDLLYQFWVHTEHVGKLGWFDRVFVSPSNHRVHHAVNDGYVDKNYGGIFILWDRLFGTFCEEQEPCVYGTRTPLRSFNPLWANLQVYAQLARRSAAAPRMVDKLRVWLKPPGWKYAGEAAEAPFVLPSAQPSGAQLAWAWLPEVSRARRIFAILFAWLALNGSAAYLWWAHTLSPFAALAAAAVVLALLWGVGQLLGGSAPGAQRNTQPAEADLLQKQ